MEGPYRAAPAEEAASAPRDQGIVGDIIGQFADPFAFYRELVQNAIDAGTPSIEVRIEASDGVVRVSVRDQGEGMDRDVLENQLLVLFRSTKERDPTKIGKFGIGFASVLSPGPRVVIVSTARDGKKLTLHLYPDLSYELFDTGTARASGTTVQLELAIEAGRVEQFVRDSHAALERWCRHASCPITFVAPGLEARIDRLLGIDRALVEVRGNSDDGAIHAVVGLTAGGEPYAGFFNHGLMLFETRDGLPGKLAFKVQDSRLGHTLSRDNVRRDAAFDRAVDFATALADKHLPGAAARALAAAVGDRPRYAALLDAIARAEVPLTAETWVLPLIEPVAARASLPLAELASRRILAAWERSPLTGAFAADGRPIVYLGAAGDTRAGWLRERMQEITGQLVHDVATAYTLITPVEPEGADARLLEELEGLLDAAYRRPSSIALVALDGELGADLAVSGALGIVNGERARRSPFRLFARGALMLNAGHGHVAAARAFAVDDPVGAASLLARAVLLHHRALDVDRSETLLAHTVARSRAS